MTIVLHKTRILTRKLMSDTIVLRQKKQKREDVETTEKHGGRRMYE